MIVAVIRVNWLARSWKNAVFGSLFTGVPLAILILSVALVGCGNPPNYFPTYPQHFDLAADGTGALTHVEISKSNPLVVNGHSIDSMGGGHAVHKRRYREHAGIRRPECNDGLGYDQLGDGAMDGC